MRPCSVRSSTSPCLAHTSSHTMGVRLEEEPRLLRLAVELAHHVLGGEHERVTVRQPGRALHRRDPELLHQVDFDGGFLRLAPNCEAPRRAQGQHVLVSGVDQEGAQVALSLQFESQVFFLVEFYMDWRVAGVGHYNSNSNFYITQI